MAKNGDLIRENKELKSRLLLAEKWIQREVKNARHHIEKEKQRKATRKHFSNIFEEEGIDIITKNIYQTFGTSLKNAPPYTLERLIDAEIYWYTLQKYPHMDGFSIVALYQKVLDDYFELILIGPFRKSFIRNERGVYNVKTRMDKDIMNIVEKGYTLSLGRVYEILSIFSQKTFFEDKSTWEYLFFSFFEKQKSHIFSTLVSGDFLTYLGQLIHLGVFGKKRHEGKVSYIDATKTRELMERILLQVCTSKII